MTKMSREPWPPENQTLFLLSLLKFVKVEDAEIVEVLKETERREKDQYWD